MDIPTFFVLFYEKLDKWPKNVRYMWNERKSEQAHIPHAPTLLENAAHYAYHHYERSYW